MEALRYKEFEPKNFFGSFFRTSKAVLLSPKVFYQGMRKEGSFLNPFLYMLCCIFIQCVFFGLMTKTLVFPFLYLLLETVLLIIACGILFFMVTKVFKASGTFEAVFRVNAYASAVCLLSWLPIVGNLLQFYRIYLTVVGLTETLSLRTARAFLAVVLTLAVLIMAFTAANHFRGGS